MRARTESEPGASEASKPVPPAVQSPALGTSPVISEAPAGSVPLAEGIRNNSIAPESLRKPYASLAPQPKKSRTTTSTNRSTTGPRPQLDSFPGVDEELTGAGQTSPGQTSPGQTSPGQASPSTKSTRAICKKHKIARDKNGVCMLCRKEEATQSSGLGWKLMVAFILLSVIVSAAIAFYVKLKHT